MYTARILGSYRDLGLKLLAPVLRSTSAVAGGHLAAGVLVVGSPLSGFTDSP